VVSVVSEFEIWGFWGKVRKRGMKFWVESVNEIATRLLIRLGKKSCDGCSKQPQQPLQMYILRQLQGRGRR